MRSSRSPVERPPGGTPFWSLLDQRSRDTLRTAGRLRAFAPKEALLRQDEMSDHLLVVRRGCVKVVSDPGVGYQAVLALRNPGDLLGEQAGLDGGPRSASLLAVTQVEALIVPSVRFTAAAREQPLIARALQIVLSERLRDADRQRAAAGAEAVRGRLAALLLDLGERYGKRLPGGAIEIALPLSQDDLAGTVLSSRRTVTRVLENWRAQGWIDTGRNRVTLRHPEALKQTLPH